MFEGRYSREEAREHLLTEKGFWKKLIEHDQSLLEKLSSGTLQQGLWLKENSAM
jgi:hypothetical protein